MGTIEKQNKKYHCKPVLQYTLEGDFVARFPSVRDAAASIGTNYSGSISRCCEGIHNRSVGGYMWRHQESEVIPERIRPYYEHTYICKRIRQYDMDGNFLREWHSAKELAEKFGITVRMIYRACRTGKPCHGYYLWYTDQVIGKPDNKRGGTRKISESLRDKMNEGLRRAKCKPVLQYDLEGNFIREWASGAEAMRVTGFDKGGISAICHGKGKSYMGYVWKLKEDVERDNDAGVPSA